MIRDITAQLKRETAAQFIGKPEVWLRLQSAVQDYRVVMRDGERYLLTQDYRTERLNVVLEKGIITDAYWG